MKKHLFLYLTVAALTCPVAFSTTAGDAKAEAPLTTAAFQQLLALEGEWLDLDGTLGPKGEVAATYEVTSSGTAVIETIFPGKPYEMVTVFHRDGDRLALTHYCSLGNQPQMRSTSVAPNEISFTLSGGTGFDPAHDRYMHSRRLRVLSATEMEGEWQEYAEGDATPELRKQYRLGRAP